MKILQQLFLKALSLSLVVTPIFCSEKAIQGLQKTTTINQGQGITPSRFEAIRKAFRDKACKIKEALKTPRFVLGATLLTLAYATAFYNRKKIFVYAAHENQKWLCDAVRYTVGLPAGIDKRGQSEILNEYRETIKHDESRPFLHDFLTQVDAACKGSLTMDFPARALFVVAAESDEAATKFVLEKYRPTESYIAHVLRYTALLPRLNNISNLLNNKWNFKGLEDFRLCRAQPIMFACAAQNEELAKSWFEQGAFYVETENTPSGAGAMLTRFEKVSGKKNEQAFLLARG